jgi:ABC-type sugar transport system substrate-binding protein
MRKALLSLAVAVVAFGAPALSLSAASAASGPSLGCNVQPSGSGNFSSVCTTSDAANTYGVTFLVQGQSATSSFAWAVPSGVTVADGCTSTSDVCVIDVSAVNEDVRLPVSVVVTQNGSSVTLSARAMINAVCGRVFC